MGRVRRGNALYVFRDVIAPFWSILSFSVDDIENPYFPCSSKANSPW